MKMFWKKRREQDVDREIQAHLDLEAEEQQQENTGLSVANARAAARRAFGNATLIREDTRAVWRWAAWDSFEQDVRYALRSARKSPAFTAMAVLSLALGIGATTGVFSIFNAVALRPLDVRNPEELALIQPSYRGNRFPLFHPLFEEIQATQQSFTGLFAVSDEPYFKAAFEQNAPAYVRGSLVTGGYFEVLGLRPALGRLLTPADDNPARAEGGACAAVISHAYWTNQMRGDPAVVGKPVAVRDRVCAIVGVAPPEFRGHQTGLALDLWVPMRPLLDPKLLASRSMAFYSGVMGRLKPGVGQAQAEAELTAIYQRMQPEEKPSPRPGEPPIKRRDHGITVTPGAQGLDRLRRDLGQPLLIALAVVVVVLLIASVNVASLMIARGAARTTEFATRLALGAGRARLMRQLIVEGLVLAGFGAALGILLAYTGAPALARLVIPANMQIGLETPLDLRVLGMAASATMLVVLLAGLLPAFRLSAGGSTGLHAGMAIAGRSTGSRSSQRTTRLLVAVQLALSLVLVTAAGLLLRTMVHVLQVDPGFRASQVVLMDIQDTSPSAKFGETDGPEEKARRAALYASLDRKLNSVAGVQSASLSWLGLFGGSYVGVNVHEVENPEGKRFTLVDYVTPRYFEAIGMQLAHGRGFGDGDAEGALRVAVVNEAFVRERLGAGQEPVGRRLIMSYAVDLRPWTVVGVVRDAKYNNLREQKSEPMMWVPLAQAPFKVSSASLRVRAGTQTTVIEEARAAMASVSPHMMVRRVTTLQAQVDQSTARERMLLSLAAGFGGIAILMAAVGLYGILAYAVARRTREIGVRLALGAQPSAVLRSVLREALVLTGAGLLLGVPLALTSVRVIKSFLFGVTEYDVLAWAGAVVVLGGIALLAALGPARRAAGVDPVIALRYE